VPSDIYWIDHPGTLRLAIMARPRAGDWLDDEIDNWKASGVELVVSLLEPEEIIELGLEREPDLCCAGGVDFVTFPIPDRGVPGNVSIVRDLVQSISVMGKATAIHCRAGIGRSSLVAAAVLVSDGIGASEAFALIGAARGVQVPDTQAQRDWVERFSDSLTAR
jgi:protein-tyrosine phosphatase